MHDVHTHLALARSEQRERVEHAARANRAARVQHLRRLDRRLERVTARARLVRLAVG